MLKRRTDRFRRNEAVRRHEGEERNKYIATLINPVDHRLYDVIHRQRPSKGIVITNPLPNEFYTDPDKMILFLSSPSCLRAWPHCSAAGAH